MFSFHSISTLLSNFCLTVYSEKIQHLFIWPLSPRKHFCSLQSRFVMRKLDPRLKGHSFRYVTAPLDINLQLVAIYMIWSSYPLCLYFYRERRKEKCVTQKLE